MALPENPIMFANNPLDRAGHQRGNADWLAHNWPATPR